MKKNRIHLYETNILDPTMMTEMLKNNISNMVPMIVIGGVINWAFSGFLCSMYQNGDQIKQK